MASTVQHLLTYEEWLRLPPVEDGTDEVVKGELRFMPPTHYPHAWIIQRLVEALIDQTDRKSVQILGSNFGLMISRKPLTCRSPDLVVYWRDKMVIEDGLLWSPPDLVVEVISPSETKRRKEEKMEDYASIGVPEAWLVSPEDRTVEIRLLADGKLAPAATLDQGDLRPSRFPGVSVVIQSVWPD
jgi:Uma2 family endonuclease